MQTATSVNDSVGSLLVGLDNIAIVIFVIEITIKLVVYRLAFFKQAWNVFDFLIVSVTLVPAGESVSVLRALRILRAFRLISMVPQMRVVVQALLHAVPGMTSIIALLFLVFYVAAVMTTTLFGAQFPDWFGTIGESLYTLFQVMTLESWSMGIVRPVLEEFPNAWIFFVPFILCTSFAVLNLFIAIIVNSMERVHQIEQSEAAALAAPEESDHEKVMKELKALREEIAELRKAKPGSGD